MLPSKVRVKLISEAAGYITFSPIVQRDFSATELVGVLLPVLGRDAARIKQILRAGSVSTGDYRYRWESLEIGDEELATVLQGFPGPDPSRAFEPESCYLVRFRHGVESLDLLTERVAKKPLFARQSFWEGLLGTFGRSVHYADYSQADRADVFASELGMEGRAKLGLLLSLLKPRSLAERLRQLHTERIEWLMRRDDSATAARRQAGQ